MTTGTTFVPFSRLLAPDDINARPLGKDGIAELADSIAVHGLIQPLAVRPSADKPDAFEIIAGRRRYLALQRLVKDRRGGWTKAREVPVLVRNEDDADALQLSLVENTARLPMHPVDQHEVFSRLVAQGLSEADIAARFALAPRTVKQQLALSRLHPKIREAWKKGKLTAEAAQAFTLAPELAQEAAYLRLAKVYRDGPSEHVVRQELSAGRTRAQDVSEAVLARYTAAGGALSDDLFSEERWIEDALLLRTYEREWRAERTAGVRDTLLGQGWAWVAVADELPHAWRWQWATVKPRHGFRMTPEQEDAHNDLITAFDEAPDDAGADTLAELALAADWYAIECEAATYTAEEKARSGVVLTLHGDYDLAAALGMIRPDESAASDQDDEDEENDDGDALPSVSSVVGETAQQDDAEDDGSPAISFALRQSLGEAQTRAVAAIVTHDSELALRLAVAAICTVTTSSPVKISIDREAHDQPETGRDFEAKLAAVMQLKYGDVVEKFTSFVGRALQLRPVFKDDSTTRAATALVAVLDPGKYATWMREAFLTDDYFKRAPKAAALAALEEMWSASPSGVLAPREDLAAMKKADLAAVAAERAARTGWLHPELRHPDYALFPQPTREAAE